MAIHALIEDQGLVWKNGVLLKKNEARAEVIEYYGKREITIRVNGALPRDLMTVIAYELDAINATYHDLKFSKRIPCNLPGL